MMVVLEVDPNLVRPGWTPLVVVLLIGIALFFLGRSMLKQFDKIDVPADHDPATSAAPAAGAPTRSHRTAGEHTVTDPGSHPTVPDLRARHFKGSGDATPPDPH